jgi:hypothetical protein
MTATTKLTVDQSRATTGDDYWKLLSSVPGRFTGTNYGAEKFTNDRQAMWKMVCDQHPLPVSTGQLMSVGRAQYQARRAELNKDLRPFGLNLKDVGKERTPGTGRWNHFYQIRHIDEPEPAASKPAPESETAARNIELTQYLDPGPTPLFDYEPDALSAKWSDPEEGGLR